MEQINQKQRILIQIQHIKVQNAINIVINKLKKKIVYNIHIYMY